MSFNDIRFGDKYRIKEGTMLKFNKLKKKVIVKVMT